jgi:hypothetical protein
MAPVRDTIHVPPEVAERYAGSSAEIQEQVQVLVSSVLGVSRTMRFASFSVPSLAAENRALYDEDFYAWTQRTAELIRAGYWVSLDGETLAEEVSDLGVNQYHAVSSDLYQVLIHLLKWQYQPDRRIEGHSWRDTIVEHRDRIDRLCLGSPSLRGKMPAMLQEEYPRARRRASLQTGLPRATFPEGCPWPLEAVLDAEFWPDAPVG